eukprot:TRINITY_DN2585_c0_g1_i5.p1 TRINITY_DN2585_c0_g1~~TRINITY_DN2585_c0_g1_i5.p1  ORF type:complete len:262 (-),score=18.41 TRINITY_DN2585_c0_g1_i5:184-855(-)
MQYTARISAFGYVKPKTFLKFNLQCTQTFKSFKKQVVPEEQAQEQLINVDDILQEAESLGSNFVFEDHDIDEPIWEFEREVQFPTSMPQQPQPQIVTPQAVTDVLSAYTEASGFKEITVDELAQQINQFALILDIRSSQQYNSAHIQHSMNIPFDALSMTIRNGDLDQYKSGHIAVVCNSGSTSAQATVKLSKVFGFEEVVNVKGGMQEWLQQERPVVKSLET